MFTNFTWSIGVLIRKITSVIVSSNTPETFFTSAKFVLHPSTQGKILELKGKSWESLAGSNADKITKWLLVSASKKGASKQLNTPLFFRYYSNHFLQIELREKCPNTELFLVRIFLYSIRIQENTEQK